METGNDVDFLMGGRYIVIFILPLVESLKQTVNDVTLANIFEYVSLLNATFEQIGRAHV